MPSYQYAQYVGYYKPGKALVVNLDPAWSTAKPRKGFELFIGTQAAVRRALHSMSTEMQFIVGPQDEYLADVLAVNSKTNEAHRAKFDAMAAQAKADKAMRKWVTKAQKLMADLSIDF